MDGPTGDAEQRLNGVLQSPRRMRGRDILYLQERLFRASVDESVLTQQRVDLTRASEDSALVMELFEPGSLPPPSAGSVNPAARYAGAVGQARARWAAQTARAVTAAAYVAVFAPLWAPPLAVARLLLWWLWRHRRWIAARLLATLVGVIAWLRARRERRESERLGEPLPSGIRGYNPRQEARPCTFCLSAGPG